MKSTTIAFFLCHALIDCSFAAEAELFDIRLTGGRTPFEGLVEIYINDEWTAICDDYMDFQTANVLCKMLGHASAISYHCCAEFGSGYGDNVFSSIRCDGHETSIEDCYYRTERHYYDESMISLPQCGHDEDLGLTCDPAEVRLKGGSNNLAMPYGRVEILYEKSWQAIYADAMNLNLAIVLCRMLDYQTAKSYHEQDWAHPRGRIINGSFRCTGEEEHFSDCVFVRGGTRNSSTRPLVAGVTCISLRIRLHNSRIENEGNVKVFYDDSWGNVCFNSWGMNEADVVCRMLGYEGASAAMLGERVSYSGVFEWVQCDGTERNLAHCNTSELKWIHCSSGFAAVRCNGEAVVPFRLSGGADPSEGRVEMFYYGSWGTVCAPFNVFNNLQEHPMNDARVICRMLGYPDALDAKCCGHYGPGVGGVFFSLPACSGKETHLLTCPLLYFDQWRCNHFQDFGVACQKNLDLEVRLVGGGTPREGRVEVLYQDTWGTVCDDNWDLDDANVVCMMLGYERAESYSCCSAYGVGSGDIVFDDVECNGSEINIGHCPRNKLRSHDCTHSEDVGVKCFGLELVLTTEKVTTQIKVTAEEKALGQMWYLSPAKTLGVMITLVMLFLIVNIAIVILSIKIHIYRRNNVTSEML